MAAHDCSKRDVENVEFIFDIMSSPGEGAIDAVDLGDALRALNCNPTLALIEKMGGTKKKGEKKNHSRGIPSNLVPS